MGLWGITLKTILITLGLWKKGNVLDGGSRRVYFRQAGDTLPGLAKQLKLDANEIHKWAKTHDNRRGQDGKTPCAVSVPNTIVVFTSKPSWHDSSLAVVTHYRKKANPSFAGSQSNTIFLIQKQP